ncbi:hypothetical protein F4802DRAFT_475354 [Xylaria palmicola]|nr:hypothetical protein F4802DRAFT_475354 [Xylaria palmicola]
MEQCAFKGNADLYGLGIRIGFYLQWYGTIVAEWLAPKEVPNFRSTNTAFITATFIAVIILRNSLFMPEIYIVLLLFFGSTIFNLFVFTWRLLTNFDHNWDPTRFKTSKPRGRVASLFWSLLLIAELSFSLWFWAVRIPMLDEEPCERYGFIFYKVQLNSLGFRILHLAIASLLMATIFVLMIWNLVSHNPQLWIATNDRVKKLRAANSIAQLFVAVVINTAVELTISWNGIGDLDSIGSAGQLIPTMIGVFGVLHIIYVFAHEEEQGPNMQNFAPRHVPPYDVRRRIKYLLASPVKIGSPSGLAEGRITREPT